MNENNQTNQTVEEQYHPKLFTDIVKMQHDLDDALAEEELLRRKIRDTVIANVIVTAILIIFLLYQFVIQPYIFPSEIQEQDIIRGIGIPVDEDEDIESDNPMYYDEELDAYILSLKVSMPILDVEKISSYNTSDLRKFAKKGKKVFCNEFFAKDKQLYEDTGGETTYYSFYDVVDQINDFIEVFSLDDIDKNHPGDKSIYTYYDFEAILNKGVAIVENNKGKNLFYGYTKETIDAVYDNLDKTQKYTEKDAIVLSLNGSGIDYNVLAQNIVESIPPVAYKNYDTSSKFIGLELKDGKIIYNSYTGEQDITETVLNAVKSVENVESVSISNDKNADIRIYLESNIIAPNDISIISDQGLY